MFYGQIYFKRVLSRDNFLKIKSLLQLYPNYSHEEPVSDPLWNSREFTGHFLRNTTSVAVPSGVNSIDENTVRC